MNKNSRWRILRILKIDQFEIANYQFSKIRLSILLRKWFARIRAAIIVAYLHFISSLIQLSTKFGCVRVRLMPRACSAFFFSFFPRFLRTITNGLFGLGKTTGKFISRFPFLVSPPMIIFNDIDEVSSASYSLFLPQSTWAREEGNDRVIARRRTHLKRFQSLLLAFCETIFRFKIHARLNNFQSKIMHLSPRTYKRNFFVW